MMNFTKLLASAVKVACLSHNVWQFYSVGNSHQESSYQISALLIILMITVNLDGLVYALSTSKYERERHIQHASLKEQFYGQTH